MSDRHRKMLGQKLWDISNELRGKMNSNEYQNYILGLIFYKYLSERMTDFADKILLPDHRTYISLRGGGGGLSLNGWG